jgi:hypothetical protein
VKVVMMLKTVFRESFLKLNYLKTIIKGKDEQFQIENNERDKLPPAVILFSILDNPSYGDSIGLNSLEYDNNSPGSIFCFESIRFDK